MKISSSFLSLLLLAAPLSAAAQVSATPSHTEEAAPCDPAELQRYAFTLTTGKAALTGFLLCTEREGELLGSVVNEFGFSSLQFSYNPAKQKLKLLSVAPFLDKWYIRRTLSRDLRFCLHTIYGFPLRGKHSYAVTRRGDAVEVFNSRRNLRYTFAPLSPSTQQLHDSQQ